MKINEKNLVSFAVSNQSIDKEGWLTKRSDYGRNVQKRWFVLKGNLLFYFDKSGDKEPLGVIVLEGCTVELVDDEMFSFKIDFQGSNSRSYYLGAESQDIMEQWMKAIACAGYDYMKIMVEQLKQQLKELEDKTMQLVSVDSSPIPPPRSRQNPFNKPEIATYSRSLSVTSNDSTSSFTSAKNIGNSSASGAAGIVKSKGLFREIHSSIGRPILLDFNNWKHMQQKNAPLSDDLIIL